MNPVQMNQKSNQMSYKISMKVAGILIKGVGIIINDANIHNRVLLYTNSA
jgi:hypothetical protein